MSHGSITVPKIFFAGVERLCEPIREMGPCRSCSLLGRIRGEEPSWRAYDEMVRRLAEVYRKAALDSGVTVRDNLTAVLSPPYPTDTGLILLGAYRYSDYPPADTLTIYGSLNQSEEDKIDYTENVVEIEGDNHAQVGNYGPQKGDALAVISAEEQ